MFDWLKRFQQRSRQRRLAVLETELGPHTSWGSGPFGASCPERRQKQLKLAQLRQMLGLKQDSNWLDEPVLESHGIKS